VARAQHRARIAARTDRRGQNRAVSRRAQIDRTLATAPPEALFLLSAISQYIGAAIAVSVFDEVEPQTVAWFRVIGASVALLALSPGFHRGWTRRDLTGAATFGVATVSMNLFFYLAIDRIDLGKSVAIEFIGPITVAAVTTRTVRNGAALALAVAGVLTLGGVELGDNTLGVMFILVSSALWAAYIVVGSRVARVRSGVVGLGVGLAIGSLVLTPVGAPWSGPVWVSPVLLLLCCATGVFSNAIGYGIDQYVLRRIPVSRFSVLLALLPVTAVFIGWAALGQRPGPLDLLGITLVLVGVALQERDEIIGLPEPG
jgi:inner membrane transporter RhtA